MISRLVIEKLTTEEALTALEPEWVSLERSSGTTLPFRTAAWTLAWWRHFRQSRFALKDSLAVRTLRTAEGALVGVAPLVVTSRPGVGWLNMRCIQFIGADPNLTELRGPLWAKQHERECFRALGDDLARDAREWDWMVWSGVPEDGPVRDELDEVSWTRDVSFYSVSLEREDWSSFKSKLPRNLKESLRKCHNSLKRDGLSYALDVAVRREEVVPALEDFFRLHTARASATGMVPHADLFRDAAARAFLGDVCGRLADQGATRIFRLRVNGRVVAARVGFVLGGSLYLYYSGFDPAFAKYSVMTTAKAEAFKYALATGLREVNLSTGKDVSKTRWRPTEHHEREGFSISPRMRGQLAHGTFEVATRALHAPLVRGYADRFVTRFRPGGKSD